MRNFGNTPPRRNTVLLQVLRQAQTVVVVDMRHSLLGNIIVCIDC